MRSRSSFVSASTYTGSFWLPGLMCLLAGCSFLERSHPPPAPAEVSHDAIRSQLVADAASDPAGKSSLQLVSAQHVVGDSERLALAEGSGPPLQLSMLDAVDFGVKNNPRLLAALAAIERSRGQEQIAFAPFLPQIDFLSHGGVTSPILGPAAAGLTGIILSGTSDPHGFAQAELQLQWTVYDFGRTSGRYRQAAARERIAELQSTRAQATVEFDVAAAYLQTLQAGAIARIQEESIRRAEATLRDTRARRDAGVAENDDVLRGEVQLAAAREDLDLARQSEMAAAARLNNALGRNAGLPITVVEWDAQPRFGLSLVQCLELAATQRPEIGIASQAVAAAQYGRDAAAAEFRPKAYALASVGGVGGSDIMSGAQEGAGLHFDMPLYTGHRLEGGLHAADADVHQALADAQSILNGISLEVTLAHLAATTALRRIDLDRPAIVEATENLRLVGNRYRNGHATPTDIVDAEVALTRAQQRLASANYEYLGALVTLDYAVNNAPGSLLGSPQPATGDPKPSPAVSPAPAPAADGK